MSGDPRLDAAYARAVDRMRVEAAHADPRRLVLGADIGRSGDDDVLLYAAPLGTPPGDDGWRLVGHATGVSFAGARERLDDEVVKLLHGGTLKLTVPGTALDRRAMSLLFGPGWPSWFRRGPRPLAPGCLPPSTIARKRGGRRG